MKRILIVDDDIDDQLILSQALLEFDANLLCHTVNNGQEALDKIHSSSLYDYIFLDLNMPVLNGLDFLRIFKQEPKYQDVPVIMLSTSSEASDAEKSKQLGAFNYFTKPDTFDKLLALVKNIFLK